MADNQVDVRKANFKMALNVFLKTVLAAILCFFLYMSVTVIVMGLGTKDIGYELYEIQSNGSAILLRTHLYENDSSAEASSGHASTDPTTTGSTTGTAIAGAAGTTASGQSSAAGTTTSTRPTNQRQMTIRSELSPAMNLLMDIIAQVLMLLLLAAFPYSILWAQGDRDKNSVNFGHMSEDKLRGLKVGLMAEIPYFFTYFLLLLSRLVVFFPNYIGIYRLFNLPFLPLFNRIIGGAGVTATAQVSWLGMLWLLLLLAVVPAVCHLAYFLGYKQISISEKLIYVNPEKKKRRRR